MNNNAPVPVTELWIIEAPGKARNLEAILKKMGMDARVFATRGHLLSFPDKLNPVGIDSELKEVERRATDPDRVRRMRVEAAVAGRVVIATDADREGDVIAWDVAEILSDIHPSPLRVRLRGMDEESILQAADEGSEVKIQDAVPGRTRAILDRLIGATYSGDGVAVGRVGTAILGLFAPGMPEITTKRLRLCAPASDNGKPWIADTAIVMPLNQENAERLRELILPKLSSSGPGEKVTGRPSHTGDILSRAADVLDISPGDAMKSMQRSYEAGRMSYPRSGSRGISEAVSSRLSDILRKANQRFDSDITAKKTKDDVHDAPHPLGTPPNLSISPHAVDTDEGIRILVAGDMVRAGQVQVVETADTNPLRSFLKSRGFHPMITEMIAGLKWKREQGPRYPGQESWQQSETYERHPAAVLMERILDEKLGHPSTWGSHVDGFLGRGLVDSELRLTDKGRLWMEKSPQALLDPRLSAAMERACERMDWATTAEGRLPWENLARTILGKTPLNEAVMATASALPAGPREDPWAGMRIPVDSPDEPEPEAFTGEENMPVPPEYMFPGDG